MENLNKKEQVVLITGSSSGIGKELCRMLVSTGYKVFGTVRSKKDSATLSKEFGSRFEPIIMDVTIESQVLKARNQVEKYLGSAKLCALINNAGVATLGPVEHMTTTEFVTQIDTKVLGTFLCTKTFLPLLGTNRKLEGPPGRIINISSILGGKIGSPFMSAYCASKHAVEAFSESIRRELKPYGIKVIIVAPGSISTPIWNTLKGHVGNMNFSDTEYHTPFNKVLKSLEKFDQNSLPIDKLSKVILKSIETKDPKIRYTPTNDFSQKLWPYIPKKLMDKFF